ncbi:alpha/beta fold hydrolase [Algimonas porphyrae]|uniref:Alpha/beta hydrolase n=1 Tax=Algimonas porphyrae TaxID=1128113 RepID=A0ABQ5V1W3_9PROT|nr:alpha/beta hydrolase [Algimonas porphyrae]GLQ21466.1 alpha/beta hydrolase [Algimonas porphyrae]
MTRRWTDHHYQSEDGLTLYARIYNGTAGRTPLLCMHGLTRNSADFHALLQQLPDWPAISVDQRGRGHSAYDPDPTRYRPDVYCKDMLALLSDLALDQVIAVGTSMGGLMTMMLANMEPGLFQAAIINDIGPEIDPKGLARLAGYVGQAMEFEDWDGAIAAIQAQGPDIFPDFSQTDWRDFAANVCEEDHDGRVRFRYDPVISQGLGEDKVSTVPPDLWPLYHGLEDLPTLIIRGETSDILSAETAEHMVQNRSAARLVSVPRRGHAPMLTEPVAITAIRAFLEPFA